MVLNEIFNFCQAAFRFCITNTVSCQPKDIIEEEVREYDGEEFETPKTGKYITVNYNREPRKDEIEACKPHIDELVREIKPEGIVYLGHTATVYKTNLPTVLLKHPAFILRQEYKLLLVRKEAHKLKQFIESIA